MALCIFQGEETTNSACVILCSSRDYQNIEEVDDPYPFQNEKVLLYQNQNPQGSFGCEEKQGGEKNFYGEVDFLLFGFTLKEKNNSSLKKLQ